MFDKERRRYGRGMKLSGLQLLVAVLWRFMAV
jgi:hypothetical protein